MTARQNPKSLRRRRERESDLHEHCWALRGIQRHLEVLVKAPGMACGHPGFGRRDEGVVKPHDGCLSEHRIDKSKHFRIGKQVEEDRLEQKRQPQLSVACGGRPLKAFRADRCYGLLAHPESRSPISLDALKREHAADDGKAVDGELCGGSFEPFWVRPRIDFEGSAQRWSQVPF